MDKHPMLIWFAWVHLPERLQVVSQPFGTLGARAADRSH